ncbi:MAG: polysaccharide biosynthesis tyrosine autokinase, partial [Planctomycetes bacterium]|nr:polysaccharide biosynthesis tyrosine autokinase [Planctomycetota bacterium]
QGPHTPFLRVLHALRRRWLPALALGLTLGAGASAGAWFVIPSPFTAFSDLRINAVPERVLFKTSEAEPGFSTYKQTQSILVKSPFVLNAALRQPGIADLPLLKEAEAATGKRPIDWLEDKLKVSSPATEFLRVSLSGERPDDLAAVVNAVVQAYLDEVVNADQKRRRERLRQLEDVHQELEEGLRTKQAALKRLAEQLDTTDPETFNVKDQLSYEYYTKLRTELVQIRYELMQAKIQQASQAAATPKGDKAQRTTDAEGTGTSGEAAANDRATPSEELIQARILSNPAYTMAYQTVNQQRMLVDQLKRKFGPKHPRVVDAEWQLQQRLNDLEKMKEDLRAAIEKELAWNSKQNAQSQAAQLAKKIGMLEKEKEEIESQLAKLEFKQGRTGVLSFELESIRKEIGQSEQIAARVSDEIERLKIELKAPPRVTLHRKADVPRYRDWKKKAAMAGFAGLGTLGLVVFALLWLDLQSGKITLLEDVTESAGLSLVGTLPMVGQSRVRFSSNGSRYDNWRDLLTESVDATRTMILREAERSGLQVVMVTSSISGEGKTTLSCHLAASLARSGRNTLLIDADVRRPAVHRIFDLPMRPGLCEAVRGDASLDEVLRPTNVEGLTLVSAGRVDEQFVKLLAHDGAEPLLNRLRGMFDFVILDSSPVLLVSDSLLIAQHADAALFAVRRDVSRVSKTVAAAMRLSMLDVPILGAVAIGLYEGGYGFGYTYYDYGYSHGYGYGYVRPLPTYGRRVHTPPPPPSQSPEQPAGTHEPVEGPTS